jgi:hypothetical protein
MSGSVKPSVAASAQSPVMVWKKMRVGQVEVLLPSPTWRPGHGLAAGDAGKVGDHALHLVEAVPPPR